ncbi:MAG: S-adenosylmethionine:tRNA ribosyltransferase-isomerase [Marinoscillum sp.]
MSSKGLNLKEFDYHLPEERIAKHPLANRSDSKLLCYNKGNISHKKFSDLPEKLPENSLLVFNNTKVIPARIIFFKETGARIEVFLLTPRKPSTVHEDVMASTRSCSWLAMIGNAKKWKKEPLVMEFEGFRLTAVRSDHDEVTFSWDSDLTFSEVLLKIGEIPLPPYLGRAVTEADKPRYQTVYSKAEGAVAAPTAGLHFTEEVIGQLTNYGIQTDYLTLHVSAGTFQPIKADRIEDHPMHCEQVLITKQNILNLLENDTVIPVGTTSMRTLESTYWFGHKLSEDPEADFFITKDSPYPNSKNLSKEESLRLVLSYMEKKGVDLLVGQTEIFIYPGYKFRICKGLITNYHLPGSTLILLVAALIGEDWRRVYNEAMTNDYRFLSYGDSSLLIP